MSISKKTRNVISHYEIIMHCRQRSKPNNLVQTINRVYYILEVLGQNPQGISIQELSLKVKLSKGTIHRLLSSLNYFGYVRQDLKTKEYFLGFKLMELGQLILSQIDLRKEAEPLLNELVHKTKETAHLVILDRMEIVYIDKVELDLSTSGLKMASRIGLRNPAHSCAVGKVLLAHLPEEELNNLIIKKGLYKRTDNTINKPSALKMHLKAVCSQGYAIDDEENEKGVRCVAAPIFNGMGKAVAAISLSGPAFRVTKRIIQGTLKKEVVKTALRISQRLGFQGGK